MLGTPRKQTTAIVALDELKRRHDQVKHRQRCLSQDYCFVYGTTM